MSDTNPSLLRGRNPRLFWAFLAILNFIATLVLLVAVYSLYGNQQGAQRFSARAFDLTEPGSEKIRGTFQMAREAVEFSSWSDGGLVKVMIPADMPPFVMISASGRGINEAKGASLMVQSSGPDDIAVSLHDKNGAKLLELGVSETGVPFLDAYTSNGQKAWSMPIASDPAP